MGRNANEAAGGGGSNMKAPDLNAGAYPARVVQVLFLGVQEQRPYKGEKKDPIDEVMLTYELSDEFMVDEEGNVLEDKPRWFSETIPFYNLQADRAKSTKRYQAIDPEGTCEGDFSKLLGLPCQVVIVKNPGKGAHAGKTFTNIGDVTSAFSARGYTQGELVNPSKYFDPMADDADVEVFRSLPEWIQTKIKKAQDFPGCALSKIVGEAPQEEKDTENPYDT